MRLPGIAPGQSPWQGGILLLNHSRVDEVWNAKCGVLNSDPYSAFRIKIERPGAFIAPGLCAITTKNKHRHRSLSLWPQVFHGGPFGVWGTPPPKPLNCKVWENPAGACANPASHSEALYFPRSKSVVLPFALSFPTNKKPCLLFR